MQRSLRILGCILLFLSGMNTFAQNTNSTDAQYVEGVVRVKLQPEVVARMSNALAPQSVSGRVKVGVKQLDQVAQKVKAVSMTRVFPYAGKDEEKHKKYGLDLWYDIKYDAPTMNTMQVRNLYKSVAGVAKAERIPVYKPIGGGKYITVSPEQIAKAAKAASTMPAAQKLPFNDPLLSEQWHYNNDGHLMNTRAGADINLFKAWESGIYGSKDVVVAIVDGGFQVDHPDLKDNVWINEAELNGKPGVDDDGDGYVDDIYGYNFVVNSANINAHEHGTHVAGTVGATNGNGIGVCGVAGGKDGTGGVKMMVCQVFDSRASNTAVSDFAAAFVYAADRGAAIAQCSWGQSAPDVWDDATNDAVHYFTKEGGGNVMNGGLCIFAAGNNGEEGKYYPGCLDDVVAVGSMASDGTVAYYSNYGDWVDVTAPGGLMDNGQAYGVLSTLPNSTYGYFEGTSMACPHVSGIAALILSKYGSKDFSNETLRTMLTTSVNDLYTLNPDYVGKMGSGYIDAYKALQGKVGSTPNAVDDYTLTPSHDNILIEWTIPDCEEKAVDHHVVYYSTEPFTAESDLSKVTRVSVDTKFKTSGDAMSYELDGLKASTKYYVALVAYSRWGKASAMSPVKEATTNAGPVVALDKTDLTMNIDAAKSKTAESEFNLKNAGEGVLKYELTTATTKSTYSLQSVKKDSKPNPGQVKPHSGAIRGAVAQSNEVVSSEYKAGEWPKELTFAKTFYSYLGETDLTLPNAQAQYFWVDPSVYPDGFNLTDVKVGGAYGENPEIEIYDGSRAISVASLLEKVTYGYFSYNSDIALPEQIHFPANSAFWVVVKFPAGYKNPLGASLTDGTDYTPYSFYSSDNGATWTQLSEVLKGTSFESMSQQMTWAITAVSKNPDWSKVLNPNPIEGEVRPGQSQKVTLKNDGQQLVNGTYKFNIKVKSNEATDSKQKVALTMNVSGYKPEMHSAQLVNFGDVLVGQSKSLDVELTNDGFGAFTGEYGNSLYAPGGVSISSDQFQAPEGCPAIAARSTGKMTITFKPTKEGNFSGTIKLTDKNGNTHSFMVRGTSAIPATLQVDKSEFDLGDLKEGEEKTATLTLKNVGNYPLQYVFPKFSSENIEGSTTRVHKYGYYSISNIGGSEDFQYEAAPALADEVDITNQFDNNNNWFSKAINVGFKFPFYGKDYTQVYVSSYGGISMIPMEAGSHFSCIVPTASCMENIGYISGFSNSGWLTLGNNSKITYGHKDGKLYVNFKNVQCPTIEEGNNMMSVSFHMVLNPDGSVEVYYDDYDPYNALGSGTFNFVGVTDVDNTDPYVLVDANHHEGNSYENPYYDIESGTAIKIVAPAKSMIKSLSSTDGYVGIGESKDVTVTVASNDELNAGELTNYLTVLTNDPNAPSKNFALKANIVGDNLKPEARYDETDVDFGNVFRTSTQNHSVLLHNDGKDVLNVAKVTVKNGKFTVADDVKDGFSVPAGQSKDVVVKLPTETEGNVEDVLVITYEDGTTHEVNLKGNVIGVPVMAVNPESIEETTPYGKNVYKSLTVSNSGDENLQFTVEPDTWFHVTDLEADDQTAKVDYVFKAKSEGDDVAYDWQDITEDYTEHMPYSYYIDKTDYKKVELPFEFPFYGKKYKYMYIYNTGFVSFDAPVEDYKQFPEPPISLPSTDTFYSNLICPFWGNHSMGTSSADGAYYKAKNDEVIVSYKNYNNTMMTGMNYQVIIRKDGSFKFQYKLDDDGNCDVVVGIAGAMDHSNTRGFTTPSSYIESGNAVEITPVKSYVVAPGKSAEVPVELLANQLADTYDYALNLTTNVPTNEKVQVPVTLNITGETSAVIPEVVNIEQPADPYGALSYTEFTVENKGTKAFTINNISSTMFDYPEDDPYGMAVGQLEVYTNTNAGGGGGDIDPWSLSDDESKMSWQPYYSGMMAPIVVGNEPVKFRIAVFNTAEEMTASYPLNFEVEGLDKDVYESTINLNITPAPALAFDNDALYLDNISDDYQGTATANMMNMGAYKLTYSLRLDASGRDEIVNDFEEGGGDIDPLLRVKAPALSKEKANSLLSANTWKIDSKQMMKAMGIKKIADSQKYYLDIPENFEYNVIYHPVLDPIANALAAVMGTGNTNLDENFYAATRFEAPAEGFNLTHLYFTGTVGTLKDVDIEATVILGSDVTAKDKTIGHGKIHVDSEEPGKTGQYLGVPRMLEFDKPIYINPADTFYVVLKYPAGYPASALMASKDGSKEPNRYMANSKSLGGWLDIEETFDTYYSYGSFGYFMTCVEKEKDEPWIKLLNTETEGEVAPDESLPINFAINAKSSYFDKNNVATLIVKSNDPLQKIVNYHIYLNKNAAPTITTPDGTVTVPEAEKSVVTIPVADEDGDAFSVSVEDKSGIASVESYANEDGTTDGIMVENGVYSVEAGKSIKLNVALTPGYETEGYYNFSVTAKDANGNERQADVKYYVEHSNRAPEFVGLTTKTMNIGTMEDVKYADLFEDADGDAFTCTVSNSDNSVADVYSATDGFAIKAKKGGNTTLTVVATDINGGVTRQDIALTVIDPTGISGITVDGNGVVSIDGDANDGNVNVTMGSDAESVVLNVYDNAGQLRAKKALKNVHAGDKASIELGQVEPGVYHLVVNVDGKTSNVKFTIK